MKTTREVIDWINEEKVLQTSAVLSEDKGLVEMRRYLRIKGFDLNPLEYGLSVERDRWYETAIVAVRLLNSKLGIDSLIGIRYVSEGYDDGGFIGDYCHCFFSVGMTEVQKTTYVQFSE